MQVVSRIECIEQEYIETFEDEEEYEDKNLHCQYRSVVL